jgi:Bacterial regulatory proteins, luxR family
MTDKEPASISQLFAGLVPDDVVAGYLKLLDAGGVPKDCTADFLGDEHLAEELSVRGMAHVLPHTPSAPATFQAASPEMALPAVLADFCDVVSGQNRRLLDGFRGLAEERSRTTRIAERAPEHLARVITDREEIMRVSGNLINSAYQDWMTLESQETEMPITDDYPIQSPAALRRGVQVRSVYDMAFAEHPMASQFIARAAAAGEQARILPKIPMKMQLADETAVLLRLTRTGATGALLIQGTPITHAMRAFFEMLWVQATPFCSAMHDGAPIDSIERRILELLTAGKQDSAIAAAVDLSESTVRRHIKVIADRLHMRNTGRFALGYEVAKRGWLTSPGGSPATSKEHHA